MIREWDRRAVEEFSMPSILLMENAGAGAARILLDLAGRDPESYGEPWVILCGSGNNGGDGFVVARHLRNAGQSVEIFLAFDTGRLEEGRDNTTNFRIIQKTRIPVHQTAPAHEPPEILARGREGPARRGTIVDALLGTGLSRPLRSPYHEWVEAANASPLPCVALDVPSGLDASSGEILGVALRARHTVTFAAAKAGFERRDGPKTAGNVHVVDIGLPREIWDADL